MALNFPQADLPSRLRGGADAWDDGVAGLILSEDFFASVITGTVYDVNCSEVTAVSESVGQSVSLTVLSPESSALADSTDRSAVFPVAGDGSAAAGDNVGGGILSTLATSEGSAATDEAAGGMLYEIRGMGDQSGESAPWNWASKTSLTLTYPISAPYPNAFRLSVNSGAFVPNLLQSGFARGERYGSYKYYADGIGTVGMWFTAGSYTVTIIPFYDGSATASLAGSAYQVDLGNGWREVFFRTGSIPGNASTVSISFRPLQVTGPTTNTTVFSKAVVVDVADFQIFGSEGAAARDTQSQSTLLGGAYDEGVWRDTSNSLLDVIKSFSNVDVLSHTDNSLVLREQAGVTGFKAQSVNLRVSALIRGNCYVDVKPGTGRGVVLSVYLVGVVNPMKLYVMPGPVININSLIDSATYVNLGGGYYRVQFFPLLSGLLVTSVVVEVAKDLGSGSSTTSYTGEAGAASVEIANLDLFVKHISVDTSDSTVTTGSTNINESQTDAANSLDASTTLMLSLLAEYATGNAIDLPISQYVVLNDTTEAGTNSDTQNGSLLAQSAGSESSPADATHNTTLSTSGAGVEAGTATDTSVTDQAVGVDNVASAPAADIPASTRVSTSSDTESANGQATVVGTYTTTSDATSPAAAGSQQSSLNTTTTTANDLAPATDNQSTQITGQTTVVETGAPLDNQLASSIFLGSSAELGTALESITSAANLLAAVTSGALSTDLVQYETGTLNLSSLEAAVSLDTLTSTISTFSYGTGEASLTDSTLSNIVTLSVAAEILMLLDQVQGLQQIPVQRSEVGAALDNSALTADNTMVAQETAAADFVASTGSITLTCIQEASAGSATQGVSAELKNTINEVASALDVSIENHWLNALCSEQVISATLSDTQLIGLSQVQEALTASVTEYAVHNMLQGVAEAAQAVEDGIGNLMTVVNTLAAAVPSDSVVATNLLSLNTLEVGVAGGMADAEGTLDCTLVEITPVLDGYTCRIVALSGVEEVALAVTVQLMDLTVVLDVLKLQNVFLVAREDRGHRVGMDIRDLVVEMERRGFEVPEDMRDAAISLEKRTFTVH